MENSSSKTVFNVPRINVLHPKTTKNSPVVEQVGFLLIAVRGDTQRGKLGKSEKAGARKDWIWACSGRFFVVFREVGFCSG